VRLLAADGGNNSNINDILPSEDISGISGWVVLLTEAWKTSIHKEKSSHETYGGLERDRDRMSPICRDGIIYM